MTSSDGLPDVGEVCAAKLCKRAVVRAERVIDFMFLKFMVRLSLADLVGMLMSILRAGDLRCGGCSMMVLIFVDQWSRPNPGYGHGYV